MTLQDIKSNPKLKPFFISKKSGGLNPCIIVKNQKDNNGVVDDELDVLGNCVACATALFNYYNGEEECKWLGNANAKTYISVAQKQGLEISPVPVKYGVNVWDDGSYGHVEFVERVEGDISYDLSSGYATYVFDSRIRKKNTGGSGQWGFKKPTKYLGCVCPPKKTDEDMILIMNGKKYRVELKEMD